MASEVYACYGHVLKLTEPTLKQLNIDLSKYDKELKEYIGDNSEHPAMSDLLEYLWCQTDLDSLECMIGNKKIEARLYYFDSDCGGPYDELEADTFYLEFNENDLFTKTPTETGKFLSEAGILPEFMTWTDFG